MKVIDISTPITEDTIMWEGESEPEIERFVSIKKGDIANSSYVKMSLHTATHMDFPKHFFDDGKTQEDFELSKFYGKVYVVEIKEDPVDRKAFEKANIPAGTKKLLIKTKNAGLYKKGSFSKEFAALNQSGAEWIVEKGIELVGIEYLSIEKYVNDNYSVHKTLLKNDVLIIEGLNLEKVAPGYYNLFALPLKIHGTDAAPIRVFLVEK